MPRQIALKRKRAACGIATPVVMTKLHTFFCVSFAFCNFFLISDPALFAGPKPISVWVNNGEDKVTQDDLRLSRGGTGVKNLVWDGTTISLLSARNETVSACVVIEAPNVTLENVSVELSDLRGPRGTVLKSSALTSSLSDNNVVENHKLFDYRGRNGELFFVRYLPIKGVSKLAYSHYDERHVPERFRRPHDANGYATGKWEDRPDHDKFYPDIAVPLELHQSFRVKQGTSQCIWMDLYVPTGMPSGVYEGDITITAANHDERLLPIQVTVLPFALPELPTARTMLYVSQEDIDQRYLGKPWVETSSIKEVKYSRKIMQRHFQMAHRHRISLIHEHTPISRMDHVWQSRLDGSLFTEKEGYAGTGIGVGNNVYSIGTYSHWPWKDGGKEVMQRNAKAWVEYFDTKKFKTPTDYFLYLIDESDDYQQIEQWASWVKTSPGPGSRLPTLATINLPEAMEKVPSLTLPCSALWFGKTEDWKKAVKHFHTTPGNDFYLYNGGRPAVGTMAIEDDGVALRQLGWAHFKSRTTRWFLWSGTYYKNYQGGAGHTRLFSDAQTFGAKGKRDPSLGETGWNYNNGDGVLFYPGTDRVYGDESYNIDGPIASLRLKHWRRGLQDYEYLELALRADPLRTQRLIEKMIPKVLWEVGISDSSDPTWVRSDISWPTSPDRWVAAKAQLAAIITRNRINP